MRNDLSNLLVLLILCTKVQIICLPIRPNFHPAQLKQLCTKVQLCDVSKGCRMSRRVSSKTYKTRLIFDLSFVKLKYFNPELFRKRALKFKSFCSFKLCNLFLPFRIKKINHYHCMKRNIFLSSTQPFSRTYVRNCYTILILCTYHSP